MPIFALGGARPEFPAHERFWVAPTATLIGRVRLLAGASIWFGAVLRGDNDWIVVGENSNVQDNCVIHTDPALPVSIGANVTIGHGAIIHSAAVGDGTLIGMGSTILSGARIGRECLIGANTLVPENGEIPARSLVLGQPARIAMQVAEEQIAMIRLSAEAYVVNSRRFRDELSVIA